MYLRKHYILGLSFVMIFVILSAGKEVFVGHLVQSLNPFLLNLLCFGPLALLFTLLYNYTSKNSFIKEIKQNRQAILGLNISTTCFWIFSFYALKYVEPSIENAINTAIGPLITLLLGNWLGTQLTKPLRIEKVISIAIFIAILFMTFISFAGKTGVGYLPFNNLFIGMLFCFIAGASIVGNTIFSKKLSSAGMKASFVLATRFYLLILVAIIMWIYDGHETTHVIDNTTNIALLGILGIGIPLYILQLGIERSDPITVAMIIALGPVFTYVFEVFDHRLILSTYTLSSVVIIVLLVMSSVITRYLHMNVTKPITSITARV